VTGEEALGLLLPTLAPGSRATYRACWRAWATWCTAGGRQTWPPLGDDIVVWIQAETARLAYTTIRQRISILRVICEAGGLHPDRDLRGVRYALRVARRELGIPRRRMSPPMTVAQLLAVSRACREARTAEAARDRAWLLIGFGAALRPGELRALCVGDLVACDDGGLEVQLQRSKTDQDGAGETVYVPTASHPELDAGYAWRHWLACRTVGRWVDESALLLAPGGLAPDAADPVAAERELPAWPRRTTTGWARANLCERGFALALRTRLRTADVEAPITLHGLRAGWATAAARAGASDAAIQAHGRWRSPESVARYVRGAHLDTPRVL